MPASFGEVYELEGFRLQAPATTPFDTVQAVLGRVKSSAPSVQTLVACLQAVSYTHLFSPSSCSQSK